MFIQKEELIEENGIRTGEYNLVCGHRLYFVHSSNARISNFGICSYIKVSQRYNTKEGMVVANPAREKQISLIIYICQQ